MVVVVDEFDGAGEAGGGGEVPDEVGGTAEGEEFGEGVVVEDIFV